MKKLMTILLLAIFLTFSRSSWAALAVIIFVFGVVKTKKLLFVALLLAFLAYFAVPRIQTRLAGITDPADSASFRLQSWRNTSEIISDNILHGVGYNAFRYAQKDYSFFEVGSMGGHAGAGADSSFLLVFATTGILGFLIFLAAYFYPINKSVLLTSAVLGMLVQSQFINLFFYPQIMFLWFVLLVLAD